MHIIILNFTSVGQRLVDSFFKIIINSFPESMGLCLAWLDVDNCSKPIKLHVVV